MILYPLVLSFFVFADLHRSFVCTWVVEGDDDTARRITLPLLPSGVYNCWVDWGDDTVSLVNGFSTSIMAPHRHVYARSGQYTMRVFGSCEGFNFGRACSDQSTRSSIRHVSAWGSLCLGTRPHVPEAAVSTQEQRPSTPSNDVDGEYFRGCNNLTSIPCLDLPRMNVMSCSRMFHGANVFDCDVSGWNVTGVTDMQGMFFGAKAFHGGDLSAWNVASVRDMTGMFYDAEVFDGNICSWDVSAAKNMSKMLKHAHAFRGDLRAWNVSGVNFYEDLFEKTYPIQQLAPWYMQHKAALMAEIAARAQVLSVVLVHVGKLCWRSLPVLFDYLFRLCSDVAPYARAHLGCHWSNRRFDQRSV
jgi:hypothetical protein